MLRFSKIVYTCISTLIFYNLPFLIFPFIYLLYIIMKRFFYLLVQFTWRLDPVIIGVAYFLANIQVLALDHLFLPQQIRMRIITEVFKRMNTDILFNACFVEYNASWLGEKVTGEKAMW